MTKISHSDIAFHLKLEYKQRLLKNASACGTVFLHRRTLIYFCELREVLATNYR